MARNRDAIFDLHAKALSWLEDYTGIPYPFQKFDFVLVPSFQYGGMEHPGQIFYNAGGILLDESATQDADLGRASVIAHETTHMWFGDLVTMNWFDDVWMKEVFANFMAAKIVHPSFPEVDHDLRFLMANHPAAYAVDRTAGRQPHPPAPGEPARGRHALRGHHLPEGAHRDAPARGPGGGGRVPGGPREYLAAHEYGNATWPDLIAVLDRQTAEDLAAWSHVWVEEPGRPTIAGDAGRGGDVRRSPRRTRRGRGGSGPRPSRPAGRDPATRGDAGGAAGRRPASPAAADGGSPLRPPQRVRRGVRALPPGPRQPAGYLEHHVPELTPALGRGPPG